MRLLVGVLISGLGLGAIYSLYALGYSLVYSILHLMNLAHGDVLILGTFAGYGLIAAGVPGILAGAMALAAGGGLALLVDQGAYRPLRSVDDRLGQLLAALAIALVFRNVVTLLFGSASKPFPSPVSSNSVLVGGVAVAPLPLLALALSGLFIAAFNVLLQRSRWGWAIQAAAQDFPTARLMGIPAVRTVALVYVLAGVLGVAGGILNGIVYSSINVGLGFSATLKAFTAAILGGIGSLYGAVVGGLVLGMVESLVEVYITSEYRDAVGFGLMIAVLLVRPQGLFGRARVTRV